MIRNVETVVDEELPKLHSKLANSRHGELMGKPPMLETQTASVTKTADLPPFESTAVWEHVTTRQRSVVVPSSGIVIASRSKFKA